MYELSRHRFAELKHYCLQYPEWKAQYILLDKKTLPRPETAIPKTEYLRAIELIETTAMDTDVKLGQYILESVTRDVSVKLLGPPCDPEEFDFYRRKFFWLLNLKKGI